MTFVRRSIHAIALAVALTLLLAACGDSDETGGSGRAATVNGVTISEADIRDEIAVLRDHPEFSQAAYGAADPSDSDARLDRDFAATVLRLRILVSVVEQEFDARGLELTDDHRTEARETYLSTLADSLDDLPEEYRAWYVEWNAKLAALAEALGAEAAERPDEVTDEDVERFFDDYPSVFAGERVCARHILLESEEDARAVIDELDEGAEFGELAVERSTDPSAQMNDGDLGCVGRGSYVEEFEDAVWNGPVGEVQGPVETEYGHHVIIVDSRGAAELGEVEPEIRSFLEAEVSRDGNQLLNLLIGQRIYEAEIDVDDRYGEWDPDTQSVIPPAAVTDR